METIKTYDLFISHAWQYTVEYNFLVEMLNKQPRFYWRNYSSPEHETIINPNTTSGKKELSGELEGQIKYSEAVLILSNMYSDSRFWMDKVLELASSYNKPIILIKSVPNEEIPNTLLHQASETADGDIDSITSAIRKVLA